MTTKKRGSNRRAFLKQSTAAATLGSAVLTGRTTFGQPGNSDILCGMIGTGGRGRSVLRAIAKVPGVRVAALCDINQKALDEALQIVGDHQPETYVYHRDLLEQANLDAVCVETPPHLHREHVTEVLSAGMHCSAAKPLALTVNQLNDIRVPVKSTGQILHVDQQLRYRPQYLQAMERIHGGDIGEIGFVRAQRDGNWDGDIRRPNLQDIKRWLYLIEQSGDTIVENQIHNIDVINWIMNDHPIKASGLGSQNMIHWEGNELMDGYGVSFEYPGDRYATFSKLSYAVSELGGTYIHAFGEKAGADVSYAGPVTIYWRGEQSEPTVIDATDVDMNFFSIRDFFEAIRVNRQPSADVTVGRDAALTTLLARKAIYEKRAVTWEELLRDGAAPNPPWLTDPDLA